MAIGDHAVPDSDILVTLAALQVAIGEIPPGDGVLDPAELDHVVDQVQTTLEPPVDLMVLYTNAKL